MTIKQIELARHALGLPNKEKTSYRNHFVCGPHDSDYTAWQEMVLEGNARYNPGGEISGGDAIFWLTRSGAELALNSDEKLDAEDFPK